MSEQKSISTAAWGQILLLGLIWGCSFLSISIALREIGPFTAVLHRTFWAMLLLWAVALAMGLKVPRDRATWGRFLVMGVLNNVLPFCLLTWGQTHIESGLVSIFNASTAAFGVLIAALVFADEKLTVRKAAGVGFGIFGVATAMGLGTLKELDLRSLAQLACIGAAFCYGCAGSWARARLSHLQPQVAAAGMLTMSTLVMIPLVWMIEGPVTLALAPATWLAIGYYSLIATSGAFLLYYSILAKAGSGNLMLVTLLVAPVAILLGAVVLGETLYPRQYAGFVIIACGLAILDGRILRLLKPRRRDTV
ncbi:EamA family transporter [Pseudooceanicola sp. 216_PA32_1]|uniref:EamA family transporter n=1 Tax=Pseudooceanicola pacificus TaxID=2676438 RepID=A0A844W7S2_9RHOB|nr:DMT family transporter [Pseudooceanicola pacificus]MWB78834.1 EamA family transporter [Pseudooceanicola pacificus]